MGTLWPRIERKEKKDEEREREKEREGKMNEEEKETQGVREEPRLAVHITLLTIRGQCHRVPSRAGPTSLHLASLGSPFALLTGFALRLLVLPPSRRALPRRLLSHPVAFRPFVSLATRARARSPLPRGIPSPSLSASLARTSTSSSRLLRRSLSHPAHLCSLFLFSSAPTDILIDRPCTRAQRSASSYRLVSSPSTRFAPFSPFPRFLLLHSFFALPALFPPPLPPSSPTRPSLVRQLYPSIRSRAQRGINYSKNLYCYYYRLTIPSVGAGEHSSPVQCATLFAPRRSRQSDDSEGGDGDDESSTSGVSLLVPVARDTIGSILRG